MGGREGSRAGGGREEETSIIYLQNDFLRFEIQRHLAVDIETNAFCVP